MRARESLIKRLSNLILVLTKCPDHFLLKIFLQKEDLQWSSHAEFQQLKISNWVSQSSHLAVSEYDDFLPKSLKGSHFQVWKTWKVEVKFRKLYWNCESKVTFKHTKSFHHWFPLILSSHELLEPMQLKPIFLRIILTLKFSFTEKTLQKWL